MIADACLIIGYVGGFCLLLGVMDFVVMTFCFIIYKSDKGKLNFWQYMKRWNN